MRWRRAVLFAATVAVHILIVWLFLSGREAPERPEEISFATLLSPQPSRTEQSRSTPIQSFGPRRAGKPKTFHPGAVDRTGPSDTAPRPAPLQTTTSAHIDWEKAAQIAAEDLVRSDAEALGRAGAPTQWKSKVMPSPAAPPAYHFPWDYAATHRVESSPQGLVINFNDRCSMLISLNIMAVIGGCKLGEIPARGDLFAHMQDDPASGTSR